MKTIYEQLSEDRKKEQEEGKYPHWFTTGGYQMFKQSYEYQADGYRDQIKRIADTLSKHIDVFPEVGTDIHTKLVENYGDNWNDIFFNLLWSGDLAASTPLLSNCGTDRGSPVSCSGGVIDDSITGFYGTLHENALLSKEGFGVSSYLGGIRPRGSSISSGGKSDGSWPVLRMFQRMSTEVSQSGVRRGSWAGYLELDHDDFDEWCDQLLAEPKGQNIGWIITRDIIKKWNEGDEELHRRRAKALRTKAITGKGYFWKVDHVNEQQPECYKKNGLTNKASNLCTEITLHADNDHTYTCVLSSMNCYNYDNWKDSGAVFAATVFLDCLCTEFIRRGENIEGLEKAVRYTKKGRSLGLGCLGFHSYLQNKNIAIEEFKANIINNEIFSHIDSESLEASKWLATKLGEPEWCEGFGIRNTHRLAVAPNMSSAIICGQVSQGIEPWLANIFMQDTAAGEMTRINPEFLKIMKKHGKFEKTVIKSIIENNGSVQHLDWLDDHEKLVFRTAFEIDQKVLLRLASNRQRFIDQAQSLNLFFSADESEEYIAEVHKEFFLDERLKSLYYLRSQAGVKAAKDECIACEG